MSELIKITNLRKTYDGKRYVLDGLNFSIGKGEIKTIFGASGCGKSTFLNIVGLLDNYKRRISVLRNKYQSKKIKRLL